VFEPENKARSIYANVLIEQGNVLAGEEKIDEAIVKFEQAQQVDSRLRFWETPKALKK
jgi:uncharacterized Ntn-hydrolase superfamily protein